MVTVGLMGTGSLPSIQTRLPAAISEVRSLPWKLNGGRQKAEVAPGWAAPMAGGRDASLGPATVQTALGPSASRVPKAPELPCAQRERDARMGVPRGGEGSAEKHPDIWC